jgi:fluoride ion exporter CrcB/FEX
MFMLAPGEPVTKVLTALIPAILGNILIVIGVLALKKETLRKHLMHAAVVVGLLGFLGTISSVAKLPSLLSGASDRPVAVVAQFLTAIVCFVFVVACVKSFVDARRAGAV